MCIRDSPALVREEHLKKVESCLQDAVDAARLGGIGYDEVSETPVSYTHLDVYKRQPQGATNGSANCIADSWRPLKGLS